MCSVREHLILSDYVFFSFWASVTLAFDDFIYRCCCNPHLQDIFTRHWRFVFRIDKILIAMKLTKFIISFLFHFLLHNKEKYYIPQQKLWVLKCTGFQLTLTPNKLERNQYLPIMSSSRLINYEIIVLSKLYNLATETIHTLS